MVLDREEAMTPKQIKAAKGLLNGADGPELYEEAPALLSAALAHIEE